MDSPGDVGVLARPAIIRRVLRACSPPSILCEGHAARRARSWCDGPFEPGQTTSLTPCHRAWRFTPIRFVGWPFPPQTKRLCAFCRLPGKITNEHIDPSWMISGDQASRHLYAREAGGPDYKPRRHVREGPWRDLAAKRPCDVCSNGWMNDMDHGVLDVIGPQLVKGAGDSHLPW